LKLFVDENFPKELEGCLREEKSDMHHGYIFHESDVKWYTDYPEIVAFNRFVSNYLEIADGENDLGWAYEFVRIGEDANDIEETSSDGADYVLRVVRSIDSDF
jgi:hypothetical protein